jgi:uncharacterized membrane-anchored protein
MNKLTRNDLKEFTDHELKVAQATIKDVQNFRAELFLGQFHKGTPIAVTTENGNTYPAYIVRVNKKTMVIGFVTDTEYNKVTWYQEKNTRKWDVEQVKRYLRSGQLHKATPSSFERGAKFKQYNYLA